MDQVSYKASVRKVRVSARKARLVVDLIRGKDVAQALAILDSLNKKVAPVVKSLLKSAIANAEQHDKEIDVEALRIKEIYVDQGQTLKRFRPRAMGRASPIRHRSSKISLSVG